MSASLSSATRRRKNYLGATSGDLDDVALVMLDTGLRMGEALKLECSDVRLDLPRERNMDTKPCERETAKIRSREMSQLLPE